MDKQLYAALCRVRRDALSQAEYWELQLEQSPLPGWTKERHMDYCKVQLSEAIAAAHYAFIRLMQLDPD